MDRNALSRNGGYRMDNTAIIIVLKMTQGKGIGCFVPDIMMPLKHLVGSCMDFLHDK